ncbi:MAG: D-alanine--D-alanine ligase [Candidatus Shapirobacteria bacterium]|jgi:D-alanine-D-alanine ligase
MKKLKVVVLMGGISSEREVSLISGNEVVKNLDKKKYEIIPVDFNGDCTWVDEIKPDLIFIALHGKYGEDGTIQSLLESMGQKYTCSGAAASILGMNKMFFKFLVNKEEIKNPKAIFLKSTPNPSFDERRGKDLEKLGWPVVIKPVLGGSSIGISIVRSKENLTKAINLAFKYDQEILIEEYIKGIEVSCSLIEDNGELLALPLVEICPKNEFFDYKSKYNEKLCQEIVPARVSDELSQKIFEISKKVFKLLKCKGMARLDFIIKNDEAYVLEINIIPGMTAQSLLPKAAKVAGINYSELLDKIIQSALG